MAQFFDAASDVGKKENVGFFIFGGFDDMTKPTAVSYNINAYIF